MIKKHKYTVLLLYQLEIPIILEHEARSPENLDKDIYEYELACSLALKIAREKNYDRDQLLEYELHPIRAAGPSVTFPKVLE